MPDETIHLSFQGRVGPNGGRPHIQFRSFPDRRVFSADIVNVSNRSKGRACFWKADVLGTTGVRVTANFCGTNRPSFHTVFTVAVFYEWNTDSARGGDGCSASGATEEVVFRMRTADNLDRLMLEKNSLRGDIEDVIVLSVEGDPGVFDVRPSLRNSLLCAGGFMTEPGKPAAADVKALVVYR